MKIKLHTLHGDTEIENDNITVIKPYKNGSAIAYKAGYKSNDGNDKIANTIVKETPEEIKNLINKVS